jgi:class 3 adenylate cyclase
MTCDACGNDAPDGSAFCNACGASLVLTCRSCGATPPPGSKFCNGCGAAVGGEAPTPPTEPAVDRSPADYTPRHLADKILHSKSALEGERKQVTVMFADVQGSMDLAGQVDAERWHEILDGFFKLLADGVHRFEGTINQYTGDGIMALFGAPISHEDHAQRACYAALHLRDELDRYATELKREHGLGFSTRIGLHSGEVVVGKIGDDLRMDYTAQGHAVGLAQRMESLASPNSCYLSNDTAALVSGYFDLEELGEFNVKGVAGTVEVHRLAGLGSSTSRFDISLARGLSRFVGRQADLRVLEDAVEQAAQGNGQVVGVVAQAGTGKSRLCFEFLERCRAQGMDVFEGRAVAHGKNIPLLPILEVFRAYFAITSKDDDRTAREKIAGRMVLLDSSFAEALPVLFEFLGVADPQRPAPKLDPEARQRQILAVMRQVIQSVSEERPTVTLIEDLHWMDEPSGEFLAHMVEARDGAQNLLLLNFRPEYHAPWMQKSWYQQIALTPLGPDAIAELIADLLGSHESLAGLAVPIHQRTGGNPFFVEEVAQSLIESDHLEGTRGAYRLVTPVERLEVPATVQALLASRIDRLDEREKKVLQVASVIGKDFAEEMLAEVVELPERALKEALAELRNAEFLYELSIFPAVQYSFKHPLTQEVALGSQLRERRRAVHKRVAAAIEVYYADHLDEQAALLAHHNEEAGEALAAARWHRIAAEWVIQTDVPAADQHLARLLGLVDDLPLDVETASLGAEACRNRLRLGWRFGMGGDEASALFQRGSEFAEAAGDSTTALQMSAGYGRSRCGDGDVQDYLDLMWEALPKAESLGEPSMIAGIHASLVDAMAFNGTVRETLEQIEARLPHYPRKLPAEEWLTAFNPHTVSSFFMGFCKFWMGRFDEARTDLLEHRRLSEEDGTPEFIGYNLMYSTELSYHALDGPGARGFARQIEELATRLGDPPSLAAYTRLARALACATNGDATGAIEAASETLEHMAEVEKFQACIPATILAEALLETGDTAAAEQAANEAVALCRRSARLNYLVLARGIGAMARLRGAGGDALDEVQAELDEVEAAIEELGVAVLSPRLLEWRAELALARSEDAERDRLLHEAQQAYVAMNAPRRVERVAKMLER